MTKIISDENDRWAVQAESLVKDFGKTRALDDLTFRVPSGTIHGLLGPNGAGKTTAVRVLTTLVRPDAGTARVGGHDTVRQARAVRACIALTGQFASVDVDLTGQENLQLVARLHGFGRRGSRARSAELLDRFDLADAGRRKVSTYSGGMRRRLDLAASLVTTPDVLFLDEPTTGLDPRSRAEIWGAIRELSRGGSTVLLTTQYLEEADQLADGITIIDHGSVVAQGTPAELKSAVGRTSLDDVFLSLTAPLPEGAAS